MSRVSDNDQIKQLRELVAERAATLGVVKQQLAHAEAQLRMAHDALSMLLLEDPIIQRLTEIGVRKVQTHRSIAQASVCSIAQDSVSVSVYWRWAIGTGPTALDAAKHLLQVLTDDGVGLNYGQEPFCAKLRELCDGAS